MSQIEHPEVQSRAQREGIIAALSCLACFAYLFAFGVRSIETLATGWLVWAAYIVLPLTLTFTLLHGSSIHREMAGLKRTAFLLTASGAILIGAAFFLGAIVSIAGIFGGLARGHF